MDGGRDGRAYHIPSRGAGGGPAAAEPGRGGTGGRMVGRPALLRARPDLAPVWADADADFPVKVTASFWSRIDHDDPADPLALQVLPHPGELAPDPEALRDPVGDAACSPVPWVVHKYPSRVLLLLTKRCHLHCRYCFRRTFDPTGAEDPSEAELDAAVRYALDAGVPEVILSGGDPLAARPGRLLHTVERLLEGGVRWVRIHTRAPITAPWSVTDALVQGLRASRRVWVVVHANHPRELSPEVDEALARLVDAGIPVLNQAVLLRGVNDDPDVLAALCEALVERRVRPYYLHATDRAPGTVHLRVSPEEGLVIVEALRRRVSGIALPTYVVDPPDGSGKQPVGEWLRARDGVGG